LNRRKQREQRMIGVLFKNPFIISSGTFLIFANQREWRYSAPSAFFCSFLA